MSKEILGYLNSLVKVEIDNIVADEEIYIKRIVDLNKENAKLKEEARWSENFKSMAQNLSSEQITYDQLKIDRDYQFKENTRLKNANANLIRKISKYRKEVNEDFIYINYLRAENKAIQAVCDDFKKDVEKLRGPHWVE